MADQSPAIYEKACKTAWSTEKEYMLLIFTSMAKHFNQKIPQLYPRQLSISLAW